MGTIDYLSLWGRSRGGIHVIFRGKRTGSVVANRETEYNEGTMEN